MKLGPFGGMMTSVDADSIPITRCRFTRNGRVDRAQFSSRNGWKNLESALGSFETASGLDFVKGYAAEGAPSEAFLAIMKAAGVVKPYEIHPTTGVTSEIQHEGSPLSLGLGDFNSVSFNGQALTLRRGVKLWEHNIGDLDHFAEVDVDRPANLAAGPNITGKTTEDLTNPTGAANIPWTGTTGTEVANTSVCSFYDVNAGDLRMNRGAPAGNEVDVVLSVAAKIIDATANEFTPTIEYTFGKSAQVVDVLLTVPPGTDMSEFADTTWLQLNVNASYFISLTSTVDQAIQFDVKIPGFPLDWSGLANIRFKITFLPNGSPAEFKISPLDTEGQPTIIVPTISGSPYTARFGYAAYDENREMESVDVTPGATIKYDEATDDDPQRWFSATDTFLGNELVFMPLATIKPATHTRVYVQVGTDVTWRLVRTIPNGETQTVDENRTTLAVKPPRVLAEPVPIGSPTCMAVHRGFVVYGYEKSQGNIRMSSVGKAWRLQRPTDTLLDKEAGADWSIADNFDDAPQVIVGAGETLFVMGSRAVYASNGSYPQEMTPFQHVPTTKGVLGRVACSYMGDDGIPGVAYLGLDQELWFVQSVAQIRKDFGFPVDLLTKDIRGVVRQYLTQTETPDTEAIRIGIDLGEDALWLTYENRALVLRRPNVVDGVRGFEYYEYEGGGWLRVAFDHPFGIRAIRATGEFDTLERTEAGAEIRGLLRDGGEEMSDAIWQSGYIASEKRIRMFSILAHRTNDEPVRVEVESDEKAATVYDFPQNQKKKRLSQYQQGHRHSITILLGEADGPINSLDIEFNLKGKRRTA